MRVSSCVDTDMQMSHVWYAYFMYVFCTHTRTSLWRALTDTFYLAVVPSPWLRAQSLESARLGLHSAPAPY